MNFREAETYLFSLGNEVSAMKLGLENIRAVLAELGDPQQKYPKVQVAGTNGKGSTCVFLDSICREAGIRTGLYTSPHLVSVTERIKIAGRDISEAKFARAATQVRDAAEKLLADGRLEYRPTFFEQITAAALVSFAEAKIELAILETGLGGRFDATTAANSEIVGITRIGFDHSEFLGDSVEQIASEKAAVIREGSSAVIGAQPSAAMDVLLKRCKEVGVTPIIADAEIEYELGLRGRHQAENAAVAVSLARILREKFTITDDGISAGLKNARHAGRLEYSGRFLFDGAHNAAGAAALREFIDAEEHRPITLVFGAMKDKNVGEMLEHIAPVARPIILAEPENSRAMNAELLGAYLPKENAADAFIAASIGEAVTEALSRTDKKGIILVTGSLYLVGDVKKYLAANPDGF